MAMNDMPQFALNPEARCPLMLVLDTSGSMSGQPIQELNEGLKTLKVELEKDATASLRVEVAIVTFGGSTTPIQLAHDFATMDYFTPPTLVTGGDTPMGEALEYALDLLNDRKEQYKNHGIKYYQPWVWLITDGFPNSNSPWQRAADKIQEAHRNKKISFFAVAVQGADIGMLKKIAPADRPPLWLNGLDFGSMFVWLSQSMQRVSKSKLGQESQTGLPPVGWGHA